MLHQVFAGALDGFRVRLRVEIVPRPPVGGVDIEVLEEKAQDGLRFVALVIEQQVSLKSPCRDDVIVPESRQRAFAPHDDIQPAAGRVEPVGALPRCR